MRRAVLWLGLVGVLTLVPGLIAAAAILPPSRVKALAMGLALPGYLCLGVLLAQDHCCGAALTPALILRGSRSFWTPFIPR